MEVKKNPEYDLNRQRPILLGLGLVVSVLIVLTAFEWKSDIDPVIRVSADRFIHIPASICFPPIPDSNPAYEVPVTVWSDDYAVVSLINPTDKYLCEVQRDEHPVLITEEMPTYPGGMKALHKFLEENLRYPQELKALDIEGRVFVSFIIEKDGKVSNVAVVKGVHQLLDEEAVRLVKQFPPFRHD